MARASSSAALTLLCASAALQSTPARTQVPPEPPTIAAKPAYLALVKAMREDELVLRTLRAQIESEKHPYNPRCLENLKPSQVTSTIAWAMEPSITTEEVAQATRFFESEAGRKVVMRLDMDSSELQELSRFTSTPAGDKLLVKHITQQPRVLMSVRGEVLYLLNTCTDTLQGERIVTLCQSERVPSPDNNCAAQFEVTERTGDDALTTRVSLYCRLPESDLISTALELPGRHETIGLVWLENRRLEILLPGSVKPLSKVTEARAGWPSYEYRTRKAGDPPVLPCVPATPIDEFGWPTR